MSHDITYQLGEAEYCAHFRSIFYNLKRVADVSVGDEIKAGQAVGYFKKGRGHDSSNVVCYTPDYNDMYLLYVCGSPIIHEGTGWFSYVGFADAKVKNFLLYPEAAPRDLAYEFCHWHDETGAERRDTPPEDMPVPYVFVSGFFRFAIQMKSLPKKMKDKDARTLEKTCAIFGDYSVVEAIDVWKDDDYTYGLVWGPVMNGYIKEEFKKGATVYIAAWIKFIDVRERIVIFQVLDFCSDRIDDRASKILECAYYLD